MFDFRKIEAFCKVCEQRSFSKAGEVLFLSQPTVSAHIQALERDLDVRLLDRMGRTVLPTPAGAVLYRYAKQAFSRLEAAKAEISALTHDISGELLIGSSNIPAYHVLPAVLARFTVEHPKVRPSLTVASSVSIAKKVLDGELMAGIVGSNASSDPDLISTHLLDSEIIGIASPDVCQRASLWSGPEDGPPELSFSKACALPWIMREESSSTRLAFDTALRESGAGPRDLRQALIVDSAHAAVHYVRAGVGVSIAARISVQEALDRGDLIAFSICGVKASRSFFHILNARRMPFPTATVFSEFLHASTFS